MLPRLPATRVHGHLRRPLLGLGLIIALAAAMLGAGPGVSGVRAQTGSCSLPPLTLPLFAATPAAALATPAAPISGLAGRPFTDDEQAEAEAAVRAIVTCINTRVPKDEWAVFTPRYIATLFTGPRPAYQPAFEQMIAEGGSGVIPNAPLFLLKSVTNGTVLEDGRIVVTIALAGHDVTYHDTLVLVKIDDHWLIDEVTGLEPPPVTPPAA